MCNIVHNLGSNTHNNGNPAGDGQAGDAGEGTGGKVTFIMKLHKVYAFFITMF